MEDKKSQLQKQADQLLKLGIEIDELKAKAIKTKVASRAEPVNQIDELHDKIETARDNLIQIYFSIRSQNNRE
jgi:ribosomal 50S subunit-associated protein YjgA (DUF615 family)